MARRGGPLRHPPARAGLEGAAGRRRRREYRIGYRTCPEHVLVYWVPGLGMARFVFSHHGTVSEVDLRLVAFEPAPPGERVREIALGPGPDDPAPPPAP